MAAWRSALPLLFVAALIVFEDTISVPSCEISGRDGGDHTDHPDDLKVMMVSDLLLHGSDAGFTDLFFRNPYTSRFFRKSFETLRPDMLVVLGDISAKGSELAERKWSTILQQFQDMIGPFSSLPLLIVFGDRDIGECSELDEKFVSQIAGNLPGLDSTGCSSFEISNISFISLNAVALVCGNNDLRFGVEKVIEKESFGLQSLVKDTYEKAVKPREASASFSSFRWRNNDAALGSGPVLLLHFPLHRTPIGNDRGTEILGDNQRGGSRSLADRGTDGAGSYEQMHTLPPNATEYIFQSLKPRMIFSAHTHNFCDHTHGDGTREVTVPAMSWATRGDPGFVLVVFRHNKAVTVSHCLLTRESHVVMAYAFMCVLLIATILVGRMPLLMNSTGH